MNEIVETLQDRENSFIQIQDLLKNVKERLDILIGSGSLSLFLYNSIFAENCAFLFKNKVRIRCIVRKGIKKNNDFTKFFKLVSELRQVDKLDGLTIISETEYIKLTPNLRDPKVLDTKSLSQNSIEL